MILYISENMLNDFKQIKNIQILPKTQHNIKLYSQFIKSKNKQYIEYPENNKINSSIIDKNNNI